MTTEPVYRESLLFGRVARLCNSFVQRWHYFVPAEQPPEQHQFFVHTWINLPIFLYTQQTKLFSDPHGVVSTPAI